MKTVLTHKMDTLDGLSVFQNPDRNDAQGPRLASNVEVVRGAGTSTTPTTQAFATAESRVVSNDVVRDGSDVKVTTVTETTNVTTEKTTAGSSTPGEVFVRIHSRMSKFDKWPDSRWASGSFQVRKTAFAEAIWRIKLRLSPSFGTRGVALLWPEGVGWPKGGELDFFEVGSDSPDRSEYHVSSHYADPQGKNAQLFSDMLKADWTKWHMFEVEKRPNLFVLRVDDKELFRTTQHVPDNPMWLGCMTAQGGLRAGQTRTPGTLDIASVEVLTP